MLNQSRVLNYIKDNLGFDFMTIELSDEKIIDYFTTYSIREFSRYFPDTKIINLNPLLESNQVSGRGNEYYINDPSGLEILNVKNIYFDTGRLYTVGHPPFGPFSMGELKSFALDVHNAGMLKMFSNFDYTFEFKHPNILRISPVPNDINNISVEYERNHSDNLSTIPNEMQNIFCELCMSDIMILIGRIRKRYGDGAIRTPFGEIPLGSEIFEEGKQLKSDVIEKLRTGSYTNVIVDFG